MTPDTDMDGLPAAPQAETQWRTSWAVLERLRRAAQHPPSKADPRNCERKADDLWRTVLLSDLQELLSPLPAAPQGDSNA